MSEKDDIKFLSYFDKMTEINDRNVSAKKTAPI